MELANYVKQLKKQNINAHAHIGYGSPKKVIPKIVNNLEIDLLVMGTHGHNSFMDIIYGETISAVRHQVNCPVLIV
jgi:manganese transport protein